MSLNAKDVADIREYLTRRGTLNEGQVEAVVSEVAYSIRHGHCAPHQKYAATGRALQKLCLIGMFFGEGGTADV